MPKFSNGIQYYDKKGNLKTVGDTFDLVITTQAEFETMIASSDWLSAKSVAFVGDGGTLTFTRSDGKGVKIPQTVKQIQGFNSAKIEVTNGRFGGAIDSEKGAIWYDIPPTTDDYFISDLSLNCPSDINNASGFVNCTHLTNCISTVTGSSSSFSNAWSFDNCTHLTDCIGIGISNSPLFGSSCGFRSCTYLTNCIGEGQGSGSGVSNGSGYGFNSCTYLTNCIGSGDSIVTGNGYGFYNCDRLTNCKGTGNGIGDGNSYAFQDCTQLTNCVGSGGDKGKTSVGYAFQDCTQLTNCTGTGEGIGPGMGSGFGFSSCTQLTNCTGTGNTTGNSKGYSFLNCSYCNGCKSGTDSTVAIWGGTITKRDDDSCEL